MVRVVPERTEALRDVSVSTRPVPTVSVRGGGHWGTGGGTGRGVDVVPNYHDDEVHLGKSPRSDSCFSVTRPSLTVRVRDQRG